MTQQKADAGVYPNEVNLALGKPFAFSLAPNYRYTHDADDALQLTDGKFTTEGGFWSGPTAKSAVAWRGESAALCHHDCGPWQGGAH